MKQRLNDSGVGGRQIGGIQTDSTHKYFNHGKLLSSTVYCGRIRRWTPVLFTVIFGESVEHYRCHFVALLKSLDASLEHDGIFDEAAAQVVDYSAAQREGFIQAYVHVRGKSSDSTEDTVFVMRIYGLYSCFI